MAQDTEIPEDVQNTPAGPDGNGFLVLGVPAPFIVGSDGNIYTRENGEISIVPDIVDSDSW